MRFRSAPKVAFLWALTLLPGGAAAAAELDQNGQPHAWSGATGRYAVVDFAAAWCGPCWKTLPKLQELAADRPDLEILVVSVDGDVKGRDRLVEDLSLTLPVLWDQDHAIAEHYLPEAMPATYLLDPNGEMIYHHTGSAASDWQAFLRVIEKVAPPPNL